MFDNLEEFTSVNASFVPREGVLTEENDLSKTHISEDINYP